RADAGNQRAEHEAEVAPEAVDTYHPRPIAWLAGIRDRGEQGRIDHRRPRAEQERGGKRGSEAAVAGNEQAERGGLDDHAGGDQGLAARVVGEPAGRELTGPPDDGVGSSDDGDLANTCAVRSQVERRQTPGERVVEVVDQPRLAADT